MSLVTVKRRWLVVVRGVRGEHRQTGLLNWLQTIAAMEEARRRGEKILYVVRCQPRRRHQ